LQDYRDIVDGPFDAISLDRDVRAASVRARLDEYFTRLYGLLSPGGLLLNHGIALRPGPSPAFARRGFIDRYVFPDGELARGRIRRVSHSDRQGSRLAMWRGWREH